MQPAAEIDCVHPLRSLRGEHALVVINEPAVRAQERLDPFCRQKIRLESNRAKAAAIGPRAQVLGIRLILGRHSSWHRPIQHRQRRQFRSVAQRPAVVRADQIAVSHIDGHIFHVTGVAPEMPAHQRESPPRSKLVLASWMRPHRQFSRRTRAPDHRGNPRDHRRHRVRLTLSPTRASARSSLCFLEPHLVLAGRIAPERLRLDHPIIPVPGWPEAENVRRRMRRLQKTQPQQRKRIAPITFHWSDDVLVQHILSHRPQGSAHRRGHQLHPARFVADVSVSVRFGVVAVVPDRRFPGRAQLPPKTICGRKRAGAQHPPPVGPCVRRPDRHTLRIVLDPQIVGDGAHHRVPYVIVKEGIVVRPSIPYPVRSGIDIAIPPVTLGCLLAIPVAGVQIACVFKSVEQRRREGQMAPVNPASPRMRRIQRTIFRRHMIARRAHCNNARRLGLRPFCHRSRGNRRVRKRGQR